MTDNTLIQLAYSMPTKDKLVSAALSNINLTIIEGEYVSICGPLGSGKPTRIGNRDFGL